MTNGRAETLRILANAFDELEQLRCRLRDDSEHVRHAMDAARNEERAAVVAYLDENMGLEFCDCCGQRSNEISVIANAIERGEHRLKEKP
jgi:hypothetical protein